MTQNIYSTHSNIISKIANYYGWDKPQQQCEWMVQMLCKQGKTQWQAFSYLVEDCLTHTDDRELDFMWFEVLKETDQVASAA